MEYNWDYLDPKAYNNKVGRYKFNREYKFILNAIKSKNVNLLDIAGGSGRLAIPLSNYCTDITVVEKNNHALYLLKSRNSSIKSISGDIMQIVIESRFSLIICIEALEYFDNWTAFFTKVNSLLKDDGTFVFTYSNPDSWRSYLRKLNHIHRKSLDYNKMDLDKLKVLLGTSGFKIVNIEGMNWIPLPLASNSILVDLFIYIEKVFRLKNWIGQSPWLLVSVKKELLK